MTTYAVIETYGDNWADTLDYNEMLRFEAPPRPDPSEGASFVDCEAWDIRYGEPAIRRAGRKYPRATYPRTIIEWETRPGMV